MIVQWAAAEQLNWTSFKGLYTEVTKAGEKVLVVMLQSCFATANYETKAGSDSSITIVPIKTTHQISLDAFLK